MKPILKVEHISKHFGGIMAINNLSFEINQNDIFGIIGPNGAGKTTAFNLITGNYKPDKGAIYLNNNQDKLQNIIHYKNYQIVHLGIARTFQNIRLFSSMSVLDNILIGFDNQANYSYFSSIFRFPSFFRSEKSIKTKAYNIMELLGIKKYANFNASNLSYGDQRKVEIARALATNPKLLLLDEPVAGMNPNESNELANILEKIKQELDITMLLIEHDMNFVNKICNRLLVLDYGKTIFEGNPKDAIKNKEVIEAYLGVDE